MTLYSSLDIQKAVTIDKDSKITATSASTSNIHPASMIIGQGSDNKTYEPKLDIYGTVSAVNMPAVQGNEASKTNLVALDVTGSEVRKTHSGLGGVSVRLMIMDSSALFFEKLLESGCEIM